MGRVVLVASGKGGTGKTTVCAALASAFALRAHTVCLVDCDIGLCNADLALGLQDRTLFHFGDVLDGRVALSDAVVAHPSLAGLSFLAAPPELPDALTETSFCAMLRTLSDLYDYCFLDAPAGLSGGFSLAAAAATQALVVCTPDTPALADASVTAARLRERGLRDIRLIVNRVVPKRIRRRRAFNVDDAMDKTGLPLAGILLEDEGVNTAFNRCVPLMLSGCRAPVRAVQDIARRLEQANARLAL